MSISLEVVERPSLEQALYASPPCASVIQARMNKEFEADADHSVKLAATHFILTQVALDPRQVQVSLQLMEEQGCVYLTLFGVSNPVPLFSLSTADPRLAQLREAIARNQASTMTRAALRVLRWRSAEKRFNRARHEDGICSRIREAMTWPDRQAYAVDAHAAAALYASNCQQLDARMVALRSSRNARLARLAREATPGADSWTGFVRAVAKVVVDTNYFA